MRAIDKDLVKRATEIADGAGYLECGYLELIEDIARFAQKVRDESSVYKEAYLGMKKNLEDRGLTSDFIKQIENFGSDLK